MTGKEPEDVEAAQDIKRLWPVKAGACTDYMIHPKSYLIYHTRQSGIIMQDIHSPAIFSLACSS